MPFSTIENVFQSRQNETGLYTGEHPEAETDIHIRRPSSTRTQIILWTARGYKRPVRGSHLDASAQAA
jgi:hypothetical protein